MVPCLQKLWEPTLALVSSDRITSFTPVPVLALSFPFLPSVIPPLSYPVLPILPIATSPTPLAPALDHSTSTFLLMIIFYYKISLVLVPWLQGRPTSLYHRHDVLEQVFPRVMTTHDTLRAASHIHYRMRECPEVSPHTFSKDSPRVPPRKILCHKGNWE